MNVELKKPDSLSPSEIDAWRRIISESEELQSPYFHPEFVRCVGRVRDDVEVAVLTAGGSIAGFFPFQRSGRSARPVGGMLSDAHGVIIRHQAGLDLPQLLSDCGLVSWSYHYQIESQIPDVKWRPDIAPAAVMDLSGGFEKYTGRLQSKSIIKQTDRKSRKLEREQGIIRFEWDSRDESAFQKLIEWKSTQYRASAIANVFSFDWTIQLLRELWGRTDDDLRGLLSVMYVDDRPAAVHFGLQAGGVLHQWFPAYDPELQSYSPGIIHLLDMARFGSENGVHRIDLGRVCHYKARVASHTVNVAEGSIDLRPITRALKHGYHQTFEWLRHSPLRTVALVPGRMLRRLTERQQFQ